MFFCEFWNNITVPLLLIRPPYKEAMQGMEIHDAFVDRFEDLSKVEDLAVKKASF